MDIKQRRFLKKIGIAPRFGDRTPSTPEDIYNGSIYVEHNEYRKINPNIHWDEITNLKWGYQESYLIAQLK